MPNSEQQEYINQMSLFHSKLVHLEETLKLEDKEAQFRKKLDFQKQKSKEGAILLAKKQQEHANQEVELLKEEGHRKSIMQKMLTVKDDKLAPMQNFLVNLEGKASAIPTNPFTILELEDQEISEFYVVQERRATDFGASQL